MKLVIASLLLFLSIYTNAQQTEINGYKPLEDLTIESPNLGYKKFMKVYVPEGYDAKGPKSYPLIILFDRQNAINNNYLLQTIGYLTTFGQMPQSVIISVASNINKRGAETILKASNENGLGEMNEKFILDELIPYANKNYHTNSFEMLIGHSRYGYFTTYMLAQHLTTFNAVVSISPFYKQNNINLVDTLINKIKTTKGISNNVYYEYVTGDSITDTQDYGLMKRALHDSVLPDYFKATGFEYYNGYHMATPGLSLGNAVYSIFGQWVMAATQYYNDTTQTTPETTKYYKAQLGIADYGDKLPFSLGTLNGKAWQYFNNNRKDKAIEAWQVALDEYPGYSELYLYMAQAAKDLGKPFANYVAAFKAGLKTSAYYTKSDRKELMKELKELDKK